MFSYMRPSGSPAEDAFVARFLTPLGFKRDRHRNLVLKIGDSPSILWSSHMDTVHHASGTQTLHFDGTVLALSRKSKNGASNCLGADDTAGIWLMTEMVKAGIEGLYVIHHGEEDGCIGSGNLSRDKKFFDGIKAAIAFDRNGYEDVITHQVGGRTASNAFARSLANILGGSYRPDDGGVYTDTNEYAEIVPECTNVSVGYFDQHRRTESQDVAFLIALRDTLVTADWSTLVIERDPAAHDPYDWGYGAGATRHYTMGSKAGRRRSYDYRGGTDLRELVDNYPEIAVAMLEDFGIDRHAFMDYVADHYGNDYRLNVEDDDIPFDADDGLPPSNTTSSQYSAVRTFDSGAWTGKKAA